MNYLTQAARQALEALESFLADYQSEDGLNSMKHYAKTHDAAIAALRAALEAQQEPVHPPAQPQQGWVLVPAYLLQKAADVLEEATTYTHSESWSPSMTDELLALRQEMLAARPQPKEPQT